MTESSPMDDAGPSTVPAAAQVFDFSQACTAFVAEIEASRNDLAIPMALRDLDTSTMLQALSSFANLKGTMDIVLRHFDPVLLAILAPWLDDIHAASAEALEDRLCALAEVASLRPDVWSFINEFIRSSPFSETPFIFLDDQSDSHRIQSLLLAYVRLLDADPYIAERNSWDVKILHRYREHSEYGVHYLAVQALSKQRGWSERKRKDMERASPEVPVLFGYDTNGPRAIDSVLYRLFEAQRISNYQTKQQDISHLSLDSTRVVMVSGVLLLRSGLSLSPPVHVNTAAMDSAMGDLVPNLQLPVLLTSPPSSGKTHLLHYLSSLLFPEHLPTNRILTIPLADTTIDVKSLIGTYVSSPTKPGTFEWMEGALAKAVRAGRWVIFDDIDRASMEMLVTITSLTRSLRPGRPGRRARLPVPGREDIEAGDGFAVFATRTSDTPATFLGHQNFSEVFLASPTDADILAILTARFPALPESVVTCLVDTWRGLRMPRDNKAKAIGLRDLEKWCARVQRSLPPAATLEMLANTPLGAFSNPVFQDEVLLEAADTFMASLDTRAVSQDRQSAMAKVVSSRIGMDMDRATVLLENRKPSIETMDKRLRIGRATLPIFTSSRRREPPSRNFALTKPSLVLLERIAATASMGEPTLLVGETGTGKTTAVQYIASICHKPLTVLNLSTQTESSDLLGGFKPIDAAVAARAVQTKWQKLFSETFSMAKPQNGAYLEAASKALGGRKWSRLAELWSSSARRAVDKLVKKDDQPDPKRRKISKVAKAGIQWQSLLVEIAEFDLHHVKMKSKLVFSFVEGPLVKALRDGEWLLLDEVNLASQETLEAISILLEGSAASLVLTERGDVEPIPRHPDFRLFACMNPATDVGKKDLPPNLRARFTELYVPPPDDNREALTTIVAQYLGDAAAGDKAVILDVVEMYATLKGLSAAKEIVDGSNMAPHYSMRTLARALMFAVETAPLFGLRRGLWEGCLMAFTMSLDESSIIRAREICERTLLSGLKNARAVLSQIPSLPTGADMDDYIRFGPFWLRRGPLPPVSESRYVITLSVQAKLSDLARVILTHRYPVLIQGPTSAGKTSAVEFLARQTGHRFVRINNHEHTDIQEYLGTYVTDPQTGNLVFQEGLLVNAVRQGHWIVLDELNLAPTDVLEALNRLLDDNRELVIPETQEVIKPHPNFILFATQNPPGLYAGRKVLSRAFRNRFLEVHFDDVPKDELETILCQRCQIAPSYAKRIVQVFEELRHRRQASRVFESKSSFATLRDLFRWAERKAVGYQQLAEDGYMLLAERARQAEDKVVIKQVIQDIMKVTVDESTLYSLFPKSDNLRLPFDSIPDSTLVWTTAMQRLFVLVASALANNEPVLLVGETGCGKTSVCELIAHAFGQQLVGVNCHQNMETADLLGSQRPVRNRNERRAKVVGALAGIAQVDPTATDDDLVQLCESLIAQGHDQTILRSAIRELKAAAALFEWTDGPLVHAMQDGHLLLLDEVSLADDSVLERLNSVLEPGRTLVLAEKGGMDIDEATLVADSAFHVVATMNPGGDFGKKELSPALRNRFTEIWVPSLDYRPDLLQIIGQSWKNPELIPLGELILDFFDWFGARIGDTAGMGLRDILAWVRFSDLITTSMDNATAFVHGGQMVVVDGLESLSQVSGMSIASIAELRRDCLDQLALLASRVGVPSIDSTLTIGIDSANFTIGGYSIPLGPLAHEPVTFSWDAPTTALNTMRVLRGCQLPKAILLEGSPGVGKTSLVSALAASTGHRLQRINLSDQTDLIDLFGSDLPVEGGNAGEFQWRDAAFLDAMQKGDWVLLDEMNLASQTVLEGLNAVLDHRGTVFIPELGRSFDRHPEFRIFAAQNPLQQGGGRKGLPKSFLNRFTKVYLQEHTSEDLTIICKALSSGIPPETVEKMIAFNEAIRTATMVTRHIGQEGSPWEFNLRDLARWFKLLSADSGTIVDRTDPVDYLRLAYLHRFRSQRDRDAVSEMFKSFFGVESPTLRPTAFLNHAIMQVGQASYERSLGSATVNRRIPHHHLEVAESILTCVEVGWLVILAGPSGGGKRAVVKSLAEQAGRPLGEFAMHPGVDTSEILGSFEQQDISRALNAAHGTVVKVIYALLDKSVHIDASKVLAAHHKTTRSKTSLEAYLAAAHDFLALAAPHTDVKNAQAALVKLAKIDPDSTGFAWVDGQLLDAIRTGGWYLISDANLCNASVLDRLNSLCETNGTLVMSEKGSETGTPEIIRPHPDFRLFMTYDPRYGELSRAMRNRGAELFVSPNPDLDPVQLVNPAIADHGSFHHLFTRGKSLLPSSTAETISVVANALVVQEAEWIEDVERIYRVQTPPVPAIRDLISAVQRSGGGHYQFCPIDESANPGLRPKTQNTMLRIAEMYFRNTSRLQHLEEWLAAPINAKSVLSVSAASVRRGPSRKGKAAGSDVYPFVQEMRLDLKEKIEYNILSDEIPISTLERVLVLLQLLEDHSKSESFDYSSASLLATGLKDLLALDSWLTSSSHLDSLASSVAITSGLGQAALWSSFRSESDLVDEELLQLADSVQDRELRYSTLQAIATMRDPAETEQLKNVLESLPESGRKSRDESERWLNWPVLAKVALEGLARGVQKGAIEPTLRLLASEARQQISPLVTLATLEVDRSPAHVFKAIEHLLSDVWAHSQPGEESLQGPAELFSPVMLASVLRFNGQSAPMVEIPQQEAALRFAIDSALWAARCRPDTKRAANQLFCVALGLILSIVGCTIDTPEVSQIAAQAEHAISSAEDWIKEPYGKYLQEPLANLAKDQSNISAIGSTWIGLSYFLLELYVTNIPIDPAARRILMGEVSSIRVTQLEEELAAIEQDEMIAKGQSESARTAESRSRLEEAIAEQANLGPASTRSTDSTRLATLFNEVHTFLADALDSSRTSALHSALLQGDPQALQREDGFQAVTGSFVHRLSVNYTDLADLVQPIIVAALFAKFGFRCLARDLELRQSTPDPAVKFILAFPSANVSSSTSRDLVTQIFETASLSRHLQPGAQRTAFLPDFVAHLGGLYNTWSDIRLREQQDAQEAESLYRVKKTDVEVLSDLEQEEKEFAELFPSYEGFTDEDAPTTTIKPEPVDRRKFVKERVVAFHQLLVGAFGDDPTHAEIYASSSEEIIQYSYKASAYDDTLDQSSLAYQIRQLHTAQVARSVSAVQPNFYLSPNEPQIRKAYDLVARLVARLEVLIQEWPEQMVLQHIRDRCDRVLALDKRSPVAQILSALEQLLIHTEDWEGFANRENSLKSFQDDASNLIIEWRKLELASWMRLLQDQAQQYIDADAEWSLRLYGALIHGTVNSADHVEHLKSVLPMLNTYLHRSTLGYFASRLQTLTAFEKMAREIASSSPHSEMLLQVATMLHNVIANAKLYEAKLSNSYSTQRSAVDKSIKDFVRLASWKDVNVYALKASAVRSHRQLHRSMRKFKDILQQPISPVMMDLNSLVSQEPPQTSSAPSLSILPVDAPIDVAVQARSEVQLQQPEHLAKLGSTFDKYQSILTNSLSTLNNIDASGEEMDSMAVEAIETAAMLAKATPANLTKDNAKVVKNLASRKRKAYADMLKSLRASGFSNSVRADSLAKQHSMDWLTQRPVLITEGLPADLDTVRKVEGYHHKMAILMIALRAAFNGHNDDIASQDLQRGIGFVESIYATALGSRDSLCGHMSQLVNLSQLVSRLKHCASAESLAGGDALAQALINAEVHVRALHDAVKEVEEGVRHFRELEGRQPGQDELVSLHEFRQESSLLAQALSLVNVAAESGHLFTQSDAELLSKSALLRERVGELLSSANVKHPELSHLFSPVISMVSALQVAATPKGITDVPLDTWKQSDDIIQKVLLVAQRLKVEDHLSARKDEEDRIDMPKTFKQTQSLTSALHIPTLLAELESLIETLSAQLTTGTSTVAVHLVGRVLPFVETLASVYDKVIQRLTFNVKSAYKLSYVVGRIVLDLAQKGFCKPQEESDKDGGDGEDGETAEGTGMGAGSGDKNVSAEIKEESQVEGLQGEEEEEKEKEEQENGDDDDAFSMENDFEGDLEDGNEKEEGEGSDDDEEDDDHDEHVGDVDPLDPGAVDEKFWGDEEKEEEKEEQNGREDMMNDKTEDKGEAEMTAKEDKPAQPESKDKEKEQKEQKDEGEQAEGKEGEKGEEVEQGDDEMEEENEGEDQNDDQAPPPVQDQVAMPEGDTLDLPEDLDFEDEDGDKDDAGELDDKMDMSGGEEEEGDDMDQDAEMASDDDGEAADDAPPAMEPTEEESNEPEANLNQNVDVSASNDAQNQDSTEQTKGAGGGQDEQAEQDKEAEEDENEADVDEQETEGEPPGGNAPKQAQGGPSGDQDEADGPVDSSGAPLPAADAQPQSARSLGDIMKDIRRRRDEILSQQERDEPSDKQDAPQEATGQVEYLKEEDEGDDQALGAAGEEERQKLADLNILDEEQQEDGQENRGMEDDDMDEEAQPTSRPPPRDADTSIKHQQPSEDARQQDKALTQSDIGGSVPTDRPDDTMELDEQDLEVEAKVEKADIDIDVELKDVSGDVVVADKGEEIWRQYSALTSDLSYALCEQLRLILEPTLATRLQGDFRTGKRLNMRKIIPYIASEYTKDKIWLRRTKPSKREYQVLLSLDDSRSMADSQSVHLAYQTLALVSQALSKLEVGQIAIAKFGEGVDILHSFGENFTDNDGTNVMNSFGFNQNKTDVVKLVERTLGFLAESRQAQASSSTAPDLWQLQIIISDGVCQDHDRLRTLLRRALEERVMIVFIIVDSLHQHGQQNGGGSGGSSILSMQTVEYKQINGEMQLEMKRYLDTFPFEFFVVLRDVEALPGVLSDTLRQWMTRVSQSQE